MHLPFQPKIKLEEILIEKSNFQSFKLKNRLFKEGLKTPKCEECGWAQKSEDGRIPLELDHINGNAHDNRLNNLRILCPNCHSLKPTHRGRNSKKKISPGGEIGTRATLKMLWSKDHVGSNPTPGITKKPPDAKRLGRFLD